MFKVLSRRRFLTSAAVVAAGSSLPGRALASRLGGDVFTNASVAPYAQGIFTQERFESHIGNLFTIYLERDRVVHMRLLTVESTQTKAKHHPFKAFHLSFDTAGVAVNQDSYLVDHGLLGRFALFVVPGISAKGALTCGAVIATPAKA